MQNTLVVFTASEVQDYDLACLAFQAQYGESTFATSISPITFCALSPERQAEVLSVIGPRANVSRRFEVLGKVYRAIESARS